MAESSLRILQYRSVFDGPFQVDQKRGSFMQDLTSGFIKATYHALEPSKNQIVDPSDIKIESISKRTPQLLRFQQRWCWYCFSVLFSWILEEAIEDIYTRHRS